MNGPVRVLETDLRVMNMRARMPFKYGIATLTALPHVFLRLHLSVDGRSAWGIAAEHLPPKWFTKNPDSAFADDIADMLTVIEHARTIAASIEEADSVFDLWMQLYSMQQRWAANEHPDFPPLLYNFGVSLVERAAISAFCHATRTTFHDALHHNTLGIRLGDVHPILAPHQPGDLLPRTLPNTLIARHTVGLGDPITDADIPAAERVDDGLPQSLEACIRAYGLTHFKIKVFGDPQRDVQRLLTIAALVEKAGMPAFHFTLDGNENYRAVVPFRELWDTLAGDERFSRLMPGLLFVEQPLHRDVSLSDEAARELLAWKQRPPMIIDESDGHLHALNRALECGYVGTSHKNCKGVFKGIASACLIARLNADTTPGAPRHILSGEDLSNVGPVALLQDLTVAATLGLTHLERNGHHYFRGLSMHSDEVQQRMLTAHGDLYRQHDRGYPTVNVQAGRVSIASLVAAPFGLGFDFDPTHLPHAAAWDPATLGL